MNTRIVARVLIGLALVLVGNGYATSDSSFGPVDQAISCGGDVGQKFLTGVLSPIVEIPVQFGHITDGMIHNDGFIGSLAGGADGFGLMIRRDLHIATDSLANIVFCVVPEPEGGLVDRIRQTAHRGVDIFDYIVFWSRDLPDDFESNPPPLVVPEQTIILTSARPDGL